LLRKKYKKTLAHLNEALTYARQANSKQKEMRLHKLFYETYKKQKKTTLALKHFEEFYTLRTQLLSDEAASNIRRLQADFEKEKSEKQAEIERLKNVELKIAYEVIEQKNKDIRDSIQYAKGIQDAILASEEEILRYFPQSFLYYRPKDIVAGDFYFFERTGSHLFYAAADCTGHGVPGALVSMVCSNALSRCVKEFKLSEPGKILDKATELIGETFKKSGNDIRDGMDISLLVKDLANDRYFWAGANNPLWLGSKGKISEIQADKQPVGFHEQRKAFTTHALSLNHGDYLFLFTDGYADQFGGPKGKKFKYQQLSALFEKHADLSPEEQKRNLELTFEAWKGNLEQVDDVCVIGIRV
jgi:serine phosphatase RsbU (regulator of sigma subunit)